MRLVNVRSVRLEEFPDTRIPRYAILSHTWEDEEILFEEFMDMDPHLKSSGVELKRGYVKIFAFCNFAKWEGYDYIWMDTCCIDKRSSAELSEAINSMCYWYQKADCCYAYLSDVEMTHDEWSFFRSRWWTRGWTLQELLAPQKVVFLSTDWKIIDDKENLAHEIQREKGIPRRALGGIKLARSESVAARMSWAAGRVTTRVEDGAYCLLGLFDCQMPLLYGERAKAFVRLQEEILRKSNDHSILAWGFGDSIPATLDHDKEYNSPHFAFRRMSHYIPSGTSVLARSPDDFRDSGDIVAIDRSTVSDIGINADSLGVNTTCPLIECTQEGQPYHHGPWEFWLAIIPCRQSSRLGSYLGVLLRRPRLSSHSQFRHRLERLVVQNPTNSDFVATFDVNPSMLLNSRVYDLTLLITPTHQGWVRDHLADSVTILVEGYYNAHIVDSLESLRELNAVSVDCSEWKCFVGRFRTFPSATSPDFSFQLKAQRNIKVGHKLVRSCSYCKLGLARHNADQTRIHLGFIPEGGSDPEVYSTRLFENGKAAVFNFEAPFLSDFEDFDLRVSELGGFPTRHIVLRFGPTS